MSDEVALWYRRYLSIDYSLWDDEEEAAGIAAGIEDNGDASVAGVQFPDGRMIAAEDWQALDEARARLGRAQKEPVREKPTPKRKITAPFGGGQTEIDASEPSWLGVRPVRP